MAITYKKALKSIAVKTLGGTTVSVSDTATEPKASAPLAEFEAFKTMHIQTGDGEITMIPFHAVDSIVVTVTQSDNITRRKLWKLCISTLRKREWLTSRANLRKSPLS